MARGMITKGDLSTAFGHQTLRRATGLWRRGRVRAVEVSADGLHIADSVRGSQGRPYNQTVSLVPTRGGNGPRITGYCTCPVALNCKHAAALLLEHLACPDAPKPAPAQAVARHRRGGFIDSQASDADGARGGGG